MDETQYHSLTNGNDRWVVARRYDSEMVTLNHTETKCIFPGSFNPIHDAHVEMANQASQILSLPVWQEISIENVEKTSLRWPDVQDRISQRFDHAGSAGLILSKAATFEEKAELFGQTIFVVGADTINRVNEIRFYENQSHRDSVFEMFAKQSCRFLVFGRSVAGRFRSYDLDLTPKLKQLCQFVRRDEFEFEISSSQLREEFRNDTPKKT
ncbi:MAG: hypothetical protein AB8B55_23265 [Mariniblastus sp.]